MATSFLKGADALAGMAAENPTVSVIPDNLHVSSADIRLPGIRLSPATMVKPPPARDVS